MFDWTASLHVPGHMLTALKTAGRRASTCLATCSPPLRQLDGESPRAWPRARRPRDGWTASLHVPGHVLAALVPRDAPPWRSTKVVGRLLEAAGLSWPGRLGVGWYTLLGVDVGAVCCRPQVAYYPDVTVVVVADSSRSSSCSSSSSSSNSGSSCSGSNISSNGMVWYGMVWHRMA